VRYHYHTLDVFTDHVFGGNQLAVFPEAGGLSGEQMQRIARELNLSETVFIDPEQPAPDTWRVRIFTPERELPFAGHPTVGTAFLLASLGRVRPVGAEARLVLAEGVGPVPVTVRWREGHPVFAQLSSARLPEVGPPGPSGAELCALLGLPPGEVLEAGRFAPEAVSCGVPFLIVPVSSREALRRVRMDSARWETLLARGWAPQVYVVSGVETGRGMAARMFAPALGIAEDPATGAAASALAGYMALRQEARSGTWRWEVVQGVEMGRPSTLFLEAELHEGRVTAVRVGGAAVRVGEGFLEVPRHPLP
jgi:trans-2,3-dihydro-3-hydroxyanthranilate isomerase